MLLRITDLIEKEKYKVRHDAMVEARPSVSSSARSLAPVDVSLSSADEEVTKPVTKRKKGSGEPAKKRGGDTELEGRKGVSTKTSWDDKLDLLELLKDRVPEDFRTSFNDPSRNFVNNQLLPALECLRVCCKGDRTEFKKRHVSLALSAFGKKCEVACK